MGGRHHHQLRHGCRRRHVFRLRATRARSPRFARLSAVASAAAALNRLAAHYMYTAGASPRAGGLHVSEGQCHIPGYNKLYYNYCIIRADGRLLRAWEHPFIVPTIVNFIGNYRALFARLYTILHYNMQNATKLASLARLCTSKICSGQTLGLQLQLKSTKEITKCHDGTVD